MALADLLGEAPWVVSGSLVSLIEEDFGEIRDVPPHDEFSKFRASGLAYLCPREEVICAREGMSRSDEISSDLELTFAHGHGLHWALQSMVLPRLKKIDFIGRWRCRGCGAVFPLSADKADYSNSSGVVGSIVPNECSSGCEAGFEYVELFFFDDFLSGHCDGLIRVPWMKGLGVFEAKSISARGFANVRSTPQEGHVKQVQAYMGMLDLEWATILYWNKGGYGVKSLIEHTVRRDRAAYEQITSDIKGIRKAITEPEWLLPERVCARKSCSRANKCAVADLCF